MALVLLIGGGHAEAQEQLAVTEWGCDGALYRAAALHDLLALELTDVGAALGAEPTARVALRTDDCEAERGTLQIEVMRGPLVCRRAILLDGTDADSRARVAAVAIAELILATRAVSTSPREPAPAAPVEQAPVVLPAAPAAPVEVAPVLPATPESTVEDWRVQLAAAVGGAFFPAASAGLGSLRIGARLAAPPGWPWLFELSLQGGTGAGASAFGGTHIHRASLQAGVLVATRGDPVEIGGGVDLDVGMVWLSGRDQAGVDHEWIDPALVLSARATLSGRVAPSVALTVDARAGWTLVGAELRSDERTLVGAAGPMIALDVGASVDLF